MNKNELLNALIDKLEIGCEVESHFNNGRNAGLIEAIKLVHAMPEEKQIEPFEPTDVVSYPVLSPSDRIRENMWKHSDLFTMFSKQQKEQLVAELVDGHLLQAVKLYKEITGMGLKESKAAIDMVKNPIDLGY